jgi:hypothetical protein
MAARGANALLVGYPPCPGAYATAMVRRISAPKSRVNWSPRGQPDVKLLAQKQL